MSGWCHSCLAESSLPGTWPDRRSPQGPPSANTACEESYLHPDHVLGALGHSYERQGSRSEETRPVKKKWGCKELIDIPRPCHKWPSTVTNLVRVAHLYQYSATEGLLKRNTGPRCHSRRYRNLDIGENDPSDKRVSRSGS